MRSKYDPIFTESKMIKEKYRRKLSRWTKEETIIFHNYITKQLAEGQEINFDELQQLLPGRTKVQLYSKNQKMKLNLQKKVLPKFQPIIKKKMEKFDNSILSYKETLNKNEGFYVSFNRANTGETLDIDFNFLKLLITMNNNSDPNYMVVNIDDTIFESVYVHLTMEKFFKNFKYIRNDFNLNKF